MKLKLAIMYGVLSWICIYLISTIFNPFFTDNIPYVNIIIPISIIIFSILFGILYIRNFNTNEVLEGLKVGIIFLIIDIICDLIFFILPKNFNVIIENYPFHIISMIILIPLITTLIGYLAQMKIELN